MDDAKMQVMAEMDVYAWSGLSQYVTRHAFCELWAEIERLREELAEIKNEVLYTVHGLNFLHARRNAAFQIPGMHDGSISEACKEQFRREFEILNILIIEFETPVAKNRSEKR